MKTRYKATSCLPIAAIALVAAACGPTIGAPCQSATGDFAAQYTLVTKTGSAKCDALLQAGDVVGLTSFAVRGAAGELPRYDLPGSVAIQTPEAGHVMSVFVDDHGVDLPAGDAAYALGNFAGAQPKGTTCNVPTFKHAHLKFGPIAATPDDPATTDADESAPGVPAYEGTWLWSNVTFVSTADAPGTAFSGNISASVPDEDGNKCSFEYKAVGLYPAIPCNTDDTTKPIADEEGHTMADPEWHPTYEQKADATLCNSQADLSKNRPIGSGINPNFKTECAAFATGSAYFCVLEAGFAKALLQP